MNFRTGYSLFASTTLCLTLSLAGCKSNPPANQTSSTSQPAASQPATPDSMSPATPAQQPAASTQQPATSGQPSPSDQSAAPNAAPGAAAPQPAAPAPPPPPVVVVLPAGTSIRVRLDSDLGSKISQPGDSFTATVADDVLKGGDVIIARGARARGAVVDAKPLGKFKGGAVLEIKLDSVRSRWGSYPVETASISRARTGQGQAFYRVDWWRRWVRRDRRRPRRWRQRRCNRRPGRRRSRHRWVRVHRQQADCAARRNAAHLQARSRSAHHHDERSGPACAADAVVSSSPACEKASPKFAFPRGGC